MEYDSAVHTTFLSEILITLLFSLVLTTESSKYDTSIDTVMDYPIVAESDGIKIRSDKMETDKMYYCIYQEKILLFYKEKNEMLNCYEIAEQEIVDKVKKSQSEDIEQILQKYLKEKNVSY